MQSFYDLMRYAKTGLAPPRMSEYDKLKALAMLGTQSGNIQTLTGQPPLSFRSDGSPLISWSMKGNGSQSATPTPDNPIMPDFCGVRMGNLFDYQTMANGVAGKFLDETGTENGSNAWTITDYIPVNGTVFTVGKLGGNAPAICLYDANKVLIAGKKYETGSAANKSDITITTSTDAKYVRFSWYSGNDSNRDDISAIILNTGSTALPYEPYGYKIPITCAGQTVPVYLGQTQTVRKIKKLVLDGSEPWALSSSIVYISNTDTERLSPLICTHFPNVQNSGMWNGNNWIFQVNISNLGMTGRDAWIAYLQQQHAAGTPVTVWYVLAEPETGIINEPLAKIGDYADEVNSASAGIMIPTVNGQNTLTVDTDLQPSEMTIMYRAKEK